MPNELWIDDVIGRGFMWEGVTSRDVRDQMATFDRKKPMLVRINSPGGVVDEATSIKSLISEWPSGVEVRIDGAAFSAASYIATVGSRVTIAEGARMMIHDPWGATEGGAKVFRAAAERLDSLRVTIAETYHKKSGVPMSQILDDMESELWLSDSQAVEYGLADEKIETTAVAYTVPEHMGYKRVPGEIMIAAWPRDQIKAFRENCSTPATVNQQPKSFPGRLKAEAALREVGIYKD